MATCRPWHHYKDSADAKWAACDLACVLVRPEELAPDSAAQPLSLPATSDGSSSPDNAAGTTTDAGVSEAAERIEVWVPPLLGFGMHDREKRVSFERLPLLSVDMSMRQEMNVLGWVNAGMAAHHTSALAAGIRQANVMAALVDRTVQCKCDWDRI